MTIHAIIEYLKYRFRAKSRHGIHSPYVYTFIEKVLLDKSPIPLSEKLTSYFGPASTISPDDIMQWKHLLQPVNTDFVIIIKGIHRRQAHTYAWQQLSAHPSVKTSIDLYTYGVLLFFEEFKEKQHFILKYPG